jgi:hypothetical protein
MASNPGYRRSWRLRGLMEEYLVVRAAEVYVHEAQDRLSGEAASWRLRDWRGDPSAERMLVELHEALGRGMRPGLSSLERRSYLEHVWVEVEGAFRSGRLALLKMPRPVFVPSREDEAEEGGEDESEPTGWVGLVIEDEEGEPVSGQRVRIKLADGTVKESVSDHKGRIRLEGIALGTCQVEFPGIDAADWRQA